MKRVVSKPRESWQQKAEAYGFRFHTMYGDVYWDESAYYQFTLKQIEDDLEDPTAEIQQMCLSLVDKVVKDEALLKKFCIPENHWQGIMDSWLNKEESLYSRLDFVYNGKGPAKLLENNADTPTSLYETGFWQWLWLEDQIEIEQLPRNVDQFNSLQEKLINRFYTFKQKYPDMFLHLSCCKNTEEDRGTVQYLQDCAAQAGLENDFLFIDDIGLSDRNTFTDLQNHKIDWMFKLYPWEFMQREEYGDYVHKSECRMIEPIWKSILSNKAMLPLLWKMFPNHPNLLPAWFDEEKSKISSNAYVKKPIFSREGSNVSIYEQGKKVEQAEGPYGKEGFIYQEYTQMPVFEGVNGEKNHTLIGSWLVGDEPAGISVREDSGRITQDMSRFLPHVILD